MREQTCCFTGHRQIPQGEQAEIIARLERTIINLNQKGVRFYGAGGALGFDTLAAKTVIHLREATPLFWVMKGIKTISISAFLEL